ncbi:FAD-dependent oxidoreductase [Streptomyces sp. NPDC006879]|uniref:FAD-dependent oxidoreductase n=1 Tax=Streptomyces sp. NPDC006879 TaxID=3364767 RepID=UPI0036B2F658
MGKEPEELTDVLIVGGGITGLSCALFLRQHGVKVVLVERHVSTSIHPRAWGWYPRTLELFRASGVEEDILAAAAGYAGHRRQATVESLAGAELKSAMLPEPGDLSSLTPSRQISLGQDRMEPIVRAGAEAAGADLRFHTELVHFERPAGEDGPVLATVKDRGSGRERTVRARWLVAADGGRSPVREALGIARRGRGVLQQQVSILFSADLEGPLDGRRFSICQIENEQLKGAVLGHDDTLSRGTLIVQLRPEDGWTVADFTPERSIELVRSAIGDPTVDVQIIGVLPWELAALSAERFRDGSVFLIGDAAHVVPPIGGYGANTGVQDAHNLAWKLAAVLRGEAGEELLDSYDTERRPVAEATLLQAQLRLMVRSGRATAEQRAATLDVLTVMLGHAYPSAAAPGTHLPQFREPQELNGEPGTRAPHLPVLLSGDGGRTPGSLLDVYGKGFVLLAGPSGEHWRTAAEAAGRAVGAALSAVSFGVELEDLSEDGWHLRYAVPADGAVLVRPDGFVAWRSPEDTTGPDAEAAITRALRRALAR